MLVNFPADMVSTGIVDDNDFNILVKRLDKSVLVMYCTDVDLS